VKMLTHLHIVVYTWWCWHICKGGSVPRVERGMGSFLPPAEIARRDSVLLRKLSAYFLLCRWEIWRIHGSVLAEKHSPDAGVGSIGRWSRAFGVVSVCGSGVQSATDTGTGRWAVTVCASGVK